MGNNVEVALSCLETANYTSSFCPAAALYCVVPSDCFLYYSLQSGHL